MGSIGLCSSIVKRSSMSVPEWPMIPALALLSSQLRKSSGDVNLDISQVVGALSLNLEIQFIGGGECNGSPVIRSCRRFGYLLKVLLLRPSTTFPPHNNNFPSISSFRTHDRHSEPIS